MKISEFGQNTTDFVETRVLSVQSAEVVARPRAMPWLSKHLT